MNVRHILSPATSLIVVLISMSGFCYQTWFISNEYLKFITTTFVTLKKYLNETTAPRIGLRVSNRVNYVSPISQRFQSINDTTNVFEATVFKMRTASLNLYQLNSFFQGGYYYVSISPSSPIKFSPTEM